MSYVHIPIARKGYPLLKWGVSLKTMDSIIQIPGDDEADPITIFDKLYKDSKIWGEDTLYEIYSFNEPKYIEVLNNYKDPYQFIEDLRKNARIIYRKENGEWKRIKPDYC